MSTSLKDAISPFPSSLFIQFRSRLHCVEIRNSRRFLLFCPRVTIQLCAPPPHLHNYWFTNTIYTHLPNEWKWEHLPHELSLVSAIQFGRSNNFSIFISFLRNLTIKSDMNNNQRATWLDFLFYSLLVKGRGNLETTLAIRQSYKRCVDLWKKMRTAYFCYRYPFVMQGEKK